MEPNAASGRSKVFNSRLSNPPEAVRLMLGKKAALAAPTLASPDASVGLGYVRPPPQELRGHPGLNAGRLQPVQTAAGDLQTFRRPPGQDGDLGLGLLELLLQRRESRELLGHDALLLRHFERRHGADRQAPLDGFQNEARALEVRVGDLEPILCGQQREIGVDGCRDR